METVKLGLTAKQSKVLSAIRELVAEGGDVGPSFREIQAKAGVKSLSNLHYVVRCLKERGHINFAPKGKRSISLV
ncbi:LexA family protein [Bradyrhizobium denitrificans]